MAHTSRDKKGLLTRIRRIKGQVEALELALTQEAECAHILQQLAAIRGAVSGLTVEVLEGHVREHLGTGEIDSNSRSNDLEQLIRVLRSYLK